MPDSRGSRGNGSAVLILELNLFADEVFGRSSGGKKQQNSGKRDRKPEGFDTRFW
jgi:hypothetical protein